MGHAVQTPFPLIAEAFRNQTVVPFLGAAASFAGADTPTALPSGSGFAKILAKAASYPGPSEDPLSKIAQFYEEIQGDRGLLLAKVVSLFCTGVPAGYACATTRFFDALPQPYLPKLVVTTNYDMLLERSFEARHIPYLAIAHIVRNSKNAGRFICYDALDKPVQDSIWTRTRLEEQLVELGESATPPVLLYKIHGTAQAGRSPRDFVDSVVLTESDYIEFIEDERFNKIPSGILKTLREANLLFLGYSLEDWNFRVLIQRLQRIQQQHKERRIKHWACRFMEQPDEVENQFWAIRGVNLYSTPLQDFLSFLLAEIKEGPCE